MVASDLDPLGHPQRYGAFVLVVLVLVEVMVVVVVVRCFLVVLVWCLLSRVVFPPPPAPGALPSVYEAPAAAVAVALSPIPIIGVVLILATPRARTNGPAFAVGWVAGLSIVMAIVLVLGSEGHGLSERWERSADRRAIIPMTEGIDSLNVAAATAVACYAAARR